MVTPKFSNPPQSFHAELKKRINQYFKENNISITGNSKLFTKAAILLVSFISIYTHLVFFTPAPFWAVLECVLFGIAGAALSFNLMHDGAHGSFSKSKFINGAVSRCWDVMGGSTFVWKMKHNIIHHSYTNVDGLDDDISVKPWLRMGESQKRYGFHRFQHLYFWFLYPLTYLFMTLLQDFLKYFKKKIGDIPMKKMTTVDHLEFWGFKIVYLALFFALPIYMVGLKAFIIGFLIFSLVNGFILSIVFQLAHTVEHTTFPTVDEKTNRLENEWAVHQVLTTANFATHNKVICWFVGGLNFQIEHHLFPKISHIHYPQISKIIKQACADYNLPYVEYPKMRKAVASHVAFLKHMGKAA
jgi:linoleoyl-CoA desaturase